MEAALGMSYAGKRAMVAMKHVGLNVAADGFINSAITGVNGGLIVVAADDPSMHSSQNEQDSTVLWQDFHLFLVLNHPISRRLMIWFLMLLSFLRNTRSRCLFRITTRLAHSRASVLLKESAS